MQICPFQELQERPGAYLSLKNNLKGTCIIGGDK